MISKKIMTIIMSVATVSATVFGGMQTFGWTGIFLKKEIQYEYQNISNVKELTGGLSDISIVVSSNEKIEYLKNPIFFDISIENTGNVDIPEKDFSSDISFKFQGDSRLIRVQQISQSSDSIIAHSEVKKDELIIQPLLLNAGDKFILRVLLDGKPSEIEPRLRVLGMKGDFIQKDKNSEHGSFYYVSVLLSILLLVITGRILAILVFGEWGSYKITPIDIMLIALVSEISAAVIIDFNGHLHEFSSVGRLAVFTAPLAIAFLISYFVIHSEDESNDQVNVKQGIEETDIQK